MFQPGQSLGPGQHIEVSPGHATTGDYISVALRGPVSEFNRGMVICAVRIRQNAERNGFWEVTRGSALLRTFYFQANAIQWAVGCVMGIEEHV